MAGVVSLYRLLDSRICCRVEDHADDRRTAARVNRLDQGARALSEGRYPQIYQRMSAAGSLADSLKATADEAKANPDAALVAQSTS